jgi:hypothetical protein
LKQFWDRKASWNKVGSLVDGRAPKALIAKALQEMYPAEANPKVAQYLYAAGGPIHVDDVVLYERHGVVCCGQVKLHVHVHGETVCFVEGWERVAAPEVGSTAARYKVNNTTMPVPAACVQTAVIYSVSAEGIATVLLPPLYR